MGGASRYGEQAHVDAGQRRAAAAAPGAAPLRLHRGAQDPRLGEHPRRAAYQPRLVRRCGAMQEEATLVPVGAVLRVELQGVARRRRGGVARQDRLQVRGGEQARKVARRCSPGRAPGPRRTTTVSTAPGPPCLAGGSAASPAGPGARLCVSIAPGRAPAGCVLGQSQDLVALGPKWD
ncbi:unnamed protein product [Prorocentrum cordatum]|uniref:Uncharacterized protein n=1 Tax=Prorocentrum cordatum TaxID=2364126 RepID=A0ABN9TPK2_9DINO|nr:unnamed protein product [Polarella glacialis]